MPARDHNDLFNDPAWDAQWDDSREADIRWSVWSSLSFAIAASAIMGSLFALLLVAVWVIQTVGSLLAHFTL